MCWRLIVCLIMAMMAAKPVAAQIYADVPRRAQPADPDAIITIAYENDIFASEDNNYTNGVRASYISPESKTPHWLEQAAETLPFYPKDGRSRWNLAVGQSIYTPNDITLLKPPSDDQPYAGWLYGTAGLVTDTGKTLDTFQITLGMVGPASGAETTQETVHHIVDSPQPQGWKYQLDNEPGVVISYQRKWRNVYEFSPFGLGVDFSPAVGGNVGNIFTDASVGAMARIGFDLPADYGPPLIRRTLGGSDFFMPSENLGGYLFAGVEGRAVGRNIFLDGNSFDDNTPHVDKENFVGSAQMGVAVTYHNTRVAYTHVFESKEFETQQQNNQYGAVTVSVRF